MKKGKPGQRMRWHAVIDRMPKDRDIIGVELGVFEGTLSAALLKYLPRLKLYLVDRWTEYTHDQIEAVKQFSRMPQRPQSYFDEAYKTMIKNVRFYKDRAIIIKEDTLQAVLKIKDNLDFDAGPELDFVFVDADHSYEGCLNDIKAWEPLIKSGGWIFGHDYGSKRHPGVKQAVDEYFKDRKIEIDKDHVWCVKL